MAEKFDIGTFGDYLKDEWIEPLGLSASKLAADIGISKMAMSKILSGKNRMSEETCWKLARYFGMSLGFFADIQSDYAVRNGEETFLEETKDLPIFDWSSTHNNRL